MATKKFTYKGGQLIDTDSEYVGWVADDTSGLHFVADANVDEAQPVYSTLTHMVTETNNPIWNSVTYKGTYNTTTSSNYDLHITLQGIKPDGTIEDIMEKRENVGTSGVDWTGYNIFDLLGSSCTNELYDQVKDDSDHGAGTIQVDLPKRYGKYEDVDIVGAWFDRAWRYRQALTIERTNGQLHGANGHYSDYYGTTVYVKYNANMSSTTQADIRFTGPDGKTLLPFFQLDVADSTSAVYIVMIPYGFLDKELEKYTYNYPEPMHQEPQYIYYYYGNAAATSASDVTLGGNALFYDDFSSDLGWTFGGNANTTEVIENGYLELRSAASQTSTAYATRNMDFSGSNSTSWEVIFKIIYDTPVYTNTTTSNGPYLRIRGRDNTGSGGSDETGSYWEVKHFYIAAGAGESGANVAGHMWGHAGYDSGVSAYGTNYANNIVCAVGDDQYIKARWNKRDTAGGGTNYIQWYQSDDGVNWNSIGDASGLTTVFDTVTYLACDLYYVGKSGVAADKYIRFDAIMAYPIMTGTRQHIKWEESFQNGTYLDRYASLNTAATRTIVETQDAIQLSTVAGQAVYATPTFNALCLYLGGGITGITYGMNDTFVYETTITAVTEGAGAGAWQQGGLFLSDTTGTSGRDTTYYGLRFTGTGASRTFVRQTWVAGALSLENAFGSWTQADLPIGLRMVFDNRERILYYMARKYGTGGEWQTIYRSPAAYEQWITGGYAVPMLIHTTSANNQTSRYTFSNWTWDNGGGVLDCHGKVGASTSAWMGEEDYTNDYPLAFHITPSGDDDMSVYYNVPSPNKPGNAMELRTKDFGGDYNYSKTFPVTDQDTIKVGPSGTDQYIGLRLVFEGIMDKGDSIEISEINFEYEVI